MRNPAMNAGAGDVEMPEVDGKDPRSGDRFEQLGKEEGLASIDSLQEGDDLGVRHEKLQSPSHFLQRNQAGRCRHLCWGTGGTILFLLLIVLGYGWIFAGGGGACAAWERLATRLDSAGDSDYLFLVGNEAGLSMAHAKGKASPAMRERIPVASASKWVSAAVLLALVQNGTLSLDDHPQRFLTSWGGPDTAASFNNSDPRRRVTLEQLLSFTSGLASSANPIACDYEEGAFDECAGAIYDALDGENIAPGEEFHYSWRHLAVAAAMAEAATGRSFNSMFLDLVARPVGMQDDPTFSRGPTSPAGGLLISPSDYARFLTALMRGDSSLMGGVVRQGMFDDATADVNRSNLTNFKSFPGGVYEKVVRWHYSFGHWIECYQDSSEWAGGCDHPGSSDPLQKSSSVLLHQSFGALGFYPVISSPTQPGTKRHWAIVAPPPDFSGMGPSKAIRVYRTGYPEIILASERLQQNKKEVSWPVDCSRGLDQAQ
ncbi:beta-lactamase/transpeptidase-like protein [Baffinella frigidus]|nr:beta-lactamase/transpeptidase-like protein [Cryptophyta sp. CCMP2293]